MGAIAEIKKIVRQHGGDDPTKFIESVKRYVVRGSAVPPGMRAEPATYAHVAHSYVHWTTDVLAALRAAADREAPIQPVVDRLFDLAVEYFRRSSEWPKPDGAFDDPMTLLVPASYALRVGRAANDLTLPLLLKVDLGAAGEFANEVLGDVADAVKRRAAKDMASILNERARGPFGSSAVARVLEAFPDDEWRASLRRARAAGRLVTAQPSPTPPPTPRPAPAPQPPAAQEIPSRDARLVGSWVYSNWVSGGYGGGSLRSDVHWFLGADGRFATSVASAGSFTGHAGQVDILIRAGRIEPGDRGRWETDGRRLVIHWDDGQRSAHPYELQGGTLLTDPDSGRFRKLWHRDR
jgi:hypothetical protein